MNEYLKYFKDIDQFLANRFPAVNLEFKIVGYVALVLAGLKTLRGTKDVDTLKTEIFTESNTVELVRALESEYGKKSPGLYKHGMYLDFVEKSIIWLPPNSEFLDVQKMKLLNIKSLKPLDVCVTKALAYCSAGVTRGNDKTDIYQAIDEGLISFGSLLSRLDETLPKREMDSRFPEMVLKLFTFVEELAAYCGSNLRLQYSVPDWVKNQ